MPLPTPAKLLSAVRNRWRLRLELCVYACTADEIRALPHPTRMRRDRWEDLALCRAWSYPLLTREQYLAVVEERRLTGGQHLYSLVEDGVLVHYGWVIARQERAPDAALGLVMVPPPGSAGLYDYFTDPIARGRGLYTDSLRQCMHDAVDLDGARQVFIYVYADNLISKRVIEKAGFKYRGSLVLERRFFLPHRYSTYVDQPLDVRSLAHDSPVPAVRAPAVVTV